MGHNSHNSHYNNNIMQTRSILLSLALTGLSMASPSEVPASETKAASPLINCGCQCAPLTFRDAKGEVQGNCRTVDCTGAQWCYVDTSYSSCADLVPSLRFPNNPWSYEACATPAPGSPLCPVAPASPAVLPIAPTVVNPAPVHPVPVAPTDIHVTVPHHDAIPAGVPSLNDVLSGGYDPESIGDIRQGDASS